MAKQTSSACSPNLPPFGRTLRTPGTLPSPGTTRTWTRPAPTPPPGDGERSFPATRKWRTHVLKGYGVPRNLPRGEESAAEPAAPPAFPPQVRPCLPQQRAQRGPRSALTKPGGASRWQEAPGSSGGRLGRAARGGVRGPGHGEAAGAARSSSARRRRAALL